MCCAADAKVYKQMYEAVAAGVSFQPALLLSFPYRETSLWGIFPMGKIELFVAAGSSCAWC